MLEPVGSVSNMQKAIIRAKLAEALTNSGGYEALTRTDVDDLLKEFNFQDGGMVSDAQRKRLGQMSGAELLCITRLTAESGFFFVESSLIEMESGKIAKTANQLMASSPITDLEKGCLQLAAKLAGQSGSGGASAGGSGNRRNGAAFNPDGIDLVYVEGTGSGIMAVKGFYIGKYEITQAQWQAIMGSNPSNFKGSGNLPVERVSWNDVQEFLSRLNSATGRNYRLPTEAEWEFAARGGTAEKFCPGGCEYSGSNNVNSVAWYDANSGDRTHPVGTKAANELGIHDMSGNVWEWCEDAHGSYRVNRGGGWINTDLSYLRVTGRYSDSPSIRSNLLGFRVVLP